MEELKKYLEKISQVPSVSGFEDEFAGCILTLIKDKVDSVRKDKLGNICAFKKGRGENRLKLLFDAHMDQIGLMITRIEENGILRFTDIGGVNPLTLYGKRVKVFGRKDLFGVIGMKPPHISTGEEIAAVDPVEKLFIDTGYSSGEEALEAVSVGDVALPGFYFNELLGNHYTGSGFDNRAGVLALISVIDQMITMNNYHDVYFLFSTQEEVGLRGAKVGGYAVNPDVAVICDVTCADPGISTIDVKTGKGPVVGKGPNYYPPLVKKICDIADREDIPVQEEVEPRPGGTNAYYLQITKQGVYTAGLSIPLRYMHSPVEIINLKDIYRASKLMVCLTADKSPITAQE